MLLFTIILLTAFNLFAQIELKKGVEFYESGDYQSAIENLQKAVEINERNGDAWRFLGMAYARTDNKEKAQESFNKAVKIPEKELSEIFDAPLKITKVSPPRYTQTARMNGIGGKIKLAVEFGKDGKIEFVFPVNELKDGLTKSAVDAAKKVKFNPATRNDKPVTYIKFVEFQFSVY